MADRIVLRVKLLGGLDTRTAGGRPVHVAGRKTQGLLAYLAIRPGVAHPRDKLSALLWGESSGSAARNNLRQTLFGLRKALGPAARAIEIVGDAITLEPSRVDVDVPRLERLVAQGHAPALLEATALYRGAFLEGVRLEDPAFEEWLLSERERLREIVINAHARLFALQRGHDSQAAIRTGISLLTIDPLQEPIHRGLMQLYIDSGRRAAALRQYQLCVDVLRRELDAEPEPATKTLYQTILRVAPAPIAVPSLRPGRLEIAPPTGPALVGRGTELGRLRQGFADARRRHGSAVLIVGESGLGKSRLIEELTVLAGGDIRVLIGRAYETERALAFGPWLDAFRSGRIFVDPTTLARLTPTSRAWLGRLFPELGQTAPATATVIEARMLFEAVDQLIATLADDAPLAIVLEDLHAADELSGQLLAFVVRRSRYRPLFFVGTAREEDWSDAPAQPAVGELDRERLLSRLRLTPLSETETLQLTRMLGRTGSARALERRVGRRMWAMSEGNPLVVVEAMHALREGTGLGLEGEASLPERIRSLIESRLDRFSPRARDLANLAAVIGRPFEFALLQRATRLNPHDAAGALEELVRRHVFHGVGDAFEFRHDRIRHVVYDALLMPRRTLLHRNVAEALEESFADDAAADHAALAYHFRAGEVWDKAVEHFRGAGLQALRRAAYAEAAAHLDAALAALARLPTTPATLAQAIDIRLDLRTALIPLGDVRRVGEVLQQAADAAARLGDAVRRAWVSVYLVHYGWLVGKYAAALGEAAVAARLADDAGERGAATLVDLYLGQIECTVGNFLAAIDHLRRVLKAAPVGAGPTLVGRPWIPARLWLVAALTEVGQFAEAFNCAADALREAEGEIHEFHQAHAHLTSGLVRLRAGLVSDAIEALERAQRIIDAGGFERSIVAFGTRALLACAYGLADRRAAATRLLAAFDADAALSGLRSYVMIFVAEAFLLAGRLDPARTLAEQTLEWAETHGEPGVAAWSVRLIAEVAARQRTPDIPTVRAMFHQAAARAANLSMAPLVAHCHLGLGSSYARAGLRDEARAELTQAAESFRSLTLVEWGERAQRALGALAD